MSTTDIAEWYRGIAGHASAPRGPAGIFDRDLEHCYGVGSTPAEALQDYQAWSGTIEAAEWFERARNDEDAMEKRTARPDGLHGIRLVPVTPAFVAYVLRHSGDPVDVRHARDVGMI